jgi:hypothetical protein
MRRGRKECASWEKIRGERTGVWGERLASGPHQEERRRRRNCRARRAQGERGRGSWAATWAQSGGGEGRGRLGRLGQLGRALGGRGRKSAGPRERNWLERGGKGFLFIFLFFYSRHKSSLKCMIHKLSQSNSKNCKVRHDAITK